MIRKATHRDIAAIAGIYGRIHEAAGQLKGVYPTVFNGIPDVMLVCMEKRLG